MPGKLAITILILAACLASIPWMLEQNPEFLRLGFSSEEPAALPAIVEPVPTPRSQDTVQVLTGRKVSIRSNASGHFSADFKINGRTVSGMIDTGATLVAINVSTVRRAGIRVSQPDFRYSVKTANGETSAASVVIERLQIGRINVEDVEAVVLEDKALDQMLIGLSFLKKLAKYQVEDGALLLVQ